MRLLRTARAVGLGEADRRIAPHADRFRGAALLLLAAAVVLGLLPPVPTPATASTEEAPEPTPEDGWLGTVEYGLIMTQQSDSLSLEYRFKTDFSTATSGGTTRGDADSVEKRPCGGASPESYHTSEYSYEHSGPADSNFYVGVDPESPTGYSFFYYVSPAYSTTYTFVERDCDGVVYNSGESNLWPAPTWNECEYPAVPEGLQAFVRTITCTEEYEGDTQGGHTATTNIRVRRSPCDATVDSDGDGVSDCSEYDSGTDPIDASDVDPGPSKPPADDWSDGPSDSGGPRYVAFGDSFQSGEGAGDYIRGTDVKGLNECHRSQNAYAPRIATHPSVPSDLTFVACSGAVIDSIGHDLDGDGRVRDTALPWNEDYQLRRAGLNSDVTLVTVGIGGNDVGFGDALRDCLIAAAAQRASRYTLPCASWLESATADEIVRLDTRGEDGLTPLQRTYEAIMQRAPNARLLVLGYPRFFPDQEEIDFYDRCEFLPGADMLWINNMIFELNEVIERNAESMGAEYVDVYLTSREHELCGQRSGSAFLNGLKPLNKVESFHPTAFGHELIADAVLKRLERPAAGSTHVVSPDETVEQAVSVAAGQRSATFSTRWPGSDVEMSLVSPSGRTIGRATSAADVTHSVGPTFEVYTVGDPEPGTWTVELYGRDVDPQGEETTLRVTTQPIGNKPPTAVVTATGSGETLAFDASGSTDPDGSIVTYQWSFSDGDSATGMQVTHTFPPDVEPSATLVVTDDGGQRGFASSPVADPPNANACPLGDVPVDRFSDTVGNVHERSIDCMAWWAVASGYPDGSYGPVRTVNRAQMATFVTRALATAGIELPSSPPDRFTDDDGNTHELAINQLAELGIVSGKAAHRYAPGHPVTRAQMATFLVRAYDFVTGTGTPAARDHFDDDNGNPHEHNINKAAEAGFAQGTGPRTYAPARSVRRDQMGSFLTRLVDRYVQVGKATPPSQR